MVHQASDDQKAILAIVLSIPIPFDWVRSCGRPMHRPGQAKVEKTALSWNHPIREAFLLHAELVPGGSDDTQGTFTEIRPHGQISTWRHRVSS
jgi:hypothetical protein